MPHYVDCRSGEPPPQVAAWNQSDAFVFSNEVRWGAPNGSMCMHAAGRAACLPAPFPGGHNAPASPPPAWAPSLLPLQTLAYWWVWMRAAAATRAEGVSARFKNYFDISGWSLLGILTSDTCTTT